MFAGGGMIELHNIHPWQWLIPIFKIWPLRADPQHCLRIISVQLIAHFLWIFFLYSFFLEFLARIFVINPPDLVFCSWRKYYILKHVSLELKCFLKASFSLFLKFPCIFPFHIFFFSPALKKCNTLKTRINFGHPVQYSGLQYVQ